MSHRRFKAPRRKRAQGKVTMTRIVVVEPVKVRPVAFVYGLGFVY